MKRGIGIALIVIGILSFIFKEMMFPTQYFIIPLDNHFVFFVVLVGIFLMIGVGIKLAKSKT